MDINKMKLVIVAVLAVACIVALMIDTSENSPWAVPLLGILVGYVVGNAQLTSQTGATAPIVAVGK